MLMVACLEAAGEVRTFTSKDGRTIEAELLGFRDDNLRVRRTDTNKEFTLPLSGLRGSDQEELRALMEKRPDLRDPIPASALRVEVSRMKLPPKVKIEERFQELEAWAYGVTVTNLTNQPITGLRVDYVIAGQSEYEKKGERGDSKPVIRQKGSLPIASVEARGRVNTRTKPLICVTRLSYDSVYQYERWVTDYSKVSDRKKMRALKGIWLRVYDGTKLVLEQSTPDKLALTEDWNAQDPESDNLARDPRFMDYFEPERK